MRIRARIAPAIEVPAEKGGMMREFFLMSLLLFSSVEDREARRFRYSFEQGYDDSCGLQVIACFLSLYWGIEASEEELAAESEVLWKASGEERTSFADMEALLSARGFSAAAYALDYPGLLGAAGRYAPLIIHYARPAGHFALVLAADEEGAVVADPSFGVERLGRGEFCSRWSGSALLAVLPGKRPRAGVLAAAVAEPRARANMVADAGRAVRRGAFGCGR
jgi:predicted double-glycine peptidase